MDSAMEWAIERERYLRARSYLECKIRGIVPMYEDNSGALTYERGVEAREAYDLSDPKHPDFHSVHADLWDNREK